MLITLKETSIFLRLLKKLWRRYRFFELWLGKIYRNSYTDRLTQGLQNKIKICSRYSFLGKITEIKKEENDTVLNESKVIIWLINSYKKFKSQLASYFNISRTRGLSNETIKELYFFPIKNFSIIVVAAIMTNIIFSIILKREIGILGWLIRAFFLLIGLSGLLSNATWEDIKKTSYFLRRINNSCKF